MAPDPSRAGLHTAEELERRERFTADLLDALGRHEGWAVLKGAAGLPSLPGDLDLVASDDTLDTLVGSTRDWLCRYDEPGFFVVRCDHIPRVPRLLARLPSQGFGRSALEIDFVSALPIRANPVITYGSVQPFIQRSRGFPAVSDNLEQAVVFLSKHLRWLRATGEPPLHLREPLVAMLGRRRAALAVSNANWAAPLLSLALLAGALGNPRLLGARIAWRLEGPRCVFDPRNGRGGRDVTVTELRDVESTGHTLVAYH